MFIWNVYNLIIYNIISEYISNYLYNYMSVCRWLKYTDTHVILKIYYINEDMDMNICG